MTPILFLILSVYLFAIAVVVRAYIQAPEFDDVPDPCLHEDGRNAKSRRILRFRTFRRVSRMRRSHECSTTLRSKQAVQ